MSDEEDEGGLAVMGPLRLATGRGGDATPATGFFLLRLDALAVELATFFRDPAAAAAALVDAGVLPLLALPASFFLRELLRLRAVGAAELAAEDEMEPDLEPELEPEPERGLTLPAAAPLRLSAADAATEAAVEAEGAAPGIREASTGSLDCA